MKDDLFIQNQSLRVVNVGSSIFLKDLEAQGTEYVSVDYAPPAQGKTAIVRELIALESQKDVIESANQLALDRVLKAQAWLTSIEPAIDVIPGLTESTFLHAGPPISYSEMAGPMKGAILGAILFEKLANNLEDADKLARSGQLTFAPAHDFHAVGPMAGIVSPHMPVHVVHDPIHHHTSYCSVNEGLGKVLRYGANHDEVIQKLRWIQTSFAPILREALSRSGPIDLKQIIAQALQMGDETHNRNKAATALFLKEITTSIFQTSAPLKEQLAAYEFIKNNDHYFLNLSMPASKVCLLAADGVSHSTFVTIMARNGVDFGIKIAGLNTWFTGPANFVKGLYFTGYSEFDAAPDIGDSAITETFGLGGFSMGGAPAIVKFVGGTVQDAITYSKKMHFITVGHHVMMQLPTLDFAPSALGIDVLKVLTTNILPIINTGIAHKDPGVGQVGAGLVEPPLVCFQKALTAFVKELNV